MAGRHALESQLSIRPANTRSADYAFVLADAGKAVEGNAAGALSFTVPPNSSVPFALGTIIEVPQIGAGAVTLTAGAGVTITGDTVTPGQGGSLLLRKTGTNAWWSAIVAVRSGTFAETPDGEPAVALVTAGNQDVTGDLRFRSGKPWLDAEAFGVVADGAADNATNGASGTSTMQAAIDACLGASPGDPDDTIRAAKFSLRWPPGDIWYSVAPKFYSITGLDCRGAGAMTRLVPTGTMTSGLDINGVANSSFSDFVVNPSGTADVECVIDYYHDPDTALRSCSNNEFRNIRVGADAINTGVGKWVHGFGVARRSPGGNQVDTTFFYRIVVSGQSDPAAPDATFWKNSVYIGNGYQGNIGDFFFYGLGTALCETHVHNACNYNLLIVGWSAGSGQVLMFDAGTNGPTHLESVEVQNVKRFWDGSAAGSGAVITTIEDVSFDTLLAPSDGFWFKYSRPGNLNIRNFRQSGGVGSLATNMRMWLNNGAALAVSIDGMQVYEPLSTAFFLNGAGPTAVNVRGWGELSRSTFLVTAMRLASVLTSAGGVVAYGTRIIGDAFNRIEMRSDGVLAFGDGTTSPGTTLTPISGGGIQVAGGVFSSSAGFSFTGTPATSGGMFPFGDAFVFRSLAAAAPMYFQDVAGNTGLTVIPSGSAAGVQVMGAGTISSGAGAPSSGNGSDGDYYLRTGTPTTANQRLYVKQSGAWVGIL